MEQPPINAIELTPVESSQIRAVGYEPDLAAETAHGTLAIQFKSGSVYHYQHVPREIYQELLTAESVGRVFGMRIKGREQEYPFTKITGPDGTNRKTGGADVF